MGSGVPRATDYGLSMQKRKIRGRVPRSVGSARHRTCGDVEDGDDVVWEVAQPARANASRTRARWARRFMTIF
jgi:hypothetical protein